MLLPPPNLSTHLCKLREAAAGVARRGDEHLGVHLPRAPILVINMAARHRGVVVLQLDLATQLRLVATQLRGDGLALWRWLGWWEWWWSGVVVVVVACRRAGGREGTRQQPPPTRRALTIEGLAHGALALVRRLLLAL